MIEWAEELPEGDERQSVLKSVAYEAARTEPAEALWLAVEQPVQPEWSDLIRYAAMQLAGKDPEGASNMANEISDESLRNQLLSSITTVWSDTNPQAAATMALLSIQSGKLQDDAVIGIVQRWVQKDPEKTAV